MNARSHRTLVRNSLYFMSVILALVSTSVTVYAQAPIASAWSTPDQISDLSSTVGGSLVTGDSAGNIYVVWCANSEDKGEDQVDTFYFRQWDGTAWSRSVDIVAARPGEPLLEYHQLILDAYGRLVLLWGQGRDLFVGIVKPSEAGRASAWRSIPILSGEQIFKSDLVADADGILHVLAVGEGQNTYYLRSEDGGKTWETTQINVGGDPTRQFSWASLAIDPSNSDLLYASWTESREDNKWSVTGVYASRSIDGGDSWSEPTAVVSAAGHGISTIAAIADGSIMIFWNRAVGSVDGRYYAVSIDQGNTWGQPQVAYERVSGLTRSPYLFTDSLGQLHMIGAGYDALTNVGGEQIWYSHWVSSRWMEPMLINVAGRPMTGNEVFDAQLVGGNRLLYTWTDAATKEIWFTSQTLPGPSIPETRLDLPTPPAPALSAQASAEAPIATPEPTPTRAALNSTNPRSTTPLHPLVAGVVPAAFIVALVVIAGARRRRKP